MASGKKLTAVELQLLFLEEAEKFCAAGGCDQVVPQAGDILALAPTRSRSSTQATWTRSLHGSTGCSSCGFSSGRWHNGPGLAGTRPKSSFSTTSTAVSIRTKGSIGSTRRRGSPSPSPVPPRSNDFFTSRRKTPARTHGPCCCGRPSPIRSIASTGIRSVSGWRAGRDGRVYRTLEMADPLAFTKADTAALFESGEPLETILDAMMHKDSAGMSATMRRRWAKRRLRKSGSCCPRQPHRRQPAAPPRAIRTSSSHQVNDFMNQKEGKTMLLHERHNETSDAGRQGPPAGGPSNLDQLRQAGESFLQAADQAIDRALGRRFAGVPEFNPPGRRAISVADRLFGLETEYAFSALGPRGARVGQGPALSRFMELARENLPHLPDSGSSGRLPSKRQPAVSRLRRAPGIGDPRAGQSLGCLPLRAGRRSDRRRDRRPIGRPRNGRRSR